MKYTYAYKTSDGKRHEDAMDAPSRDAAKATKSDDELIAFWEGMNDRLRNLGIKPIPLESLE